MPYKDIKDIPHADFKAIFLLLQNGVIGWTSEAVNTYTTYSHHHMMLQALNKQLNPKFKPKEAMPFPQLFPAVETLMKMGVEEKKLTVQEQFARTFLSRMPDKHKKKFGV